VGRDDADSAGGRPWLCDDYSWPWIFFINVPLALFCAPVAWRMLKRYEDKLQRLPIDKVGLALLIVAVGSLQLMLDLGKEHDWFESAEICALAIVAVIGLAAFIIWESTERHPIVDLRVFRHRGFSACVLTISIGFGGFFAANVLTPALAAELHGLHVLLDSVRSVLDGMTQGQSVMLATNEVMATCAIAFCAAALLIWLAPRSARVIDMRKVGH
jgi:MFS family permease